ncbi:MAG: Pycsar system effector family protein [Bacteroidota bacterium]
MDKKELLAFKEQLKTEIKAEIKQEKKKKKKGKDVETGPTNDVVEVRGNFYTKGEPRKSFATFMRNQNKFYVNSLNVIDRKAAIMIRVNATIISAIVLFFQHLEDVQFGIFIGTVMVLFSFVSLMSAISASRPDTFAMAKRYKETILKKRPKLEENLFLVGMHADKTLEQYEDAYHQVVENQELQIGNQVRTMYAFEKQIHKSYQQIEVAYTAFMVGFSVVVLIFVGGLVSQFLQ